MERNFITQLFHSCCLGLSAQVLNSSQQPLARTLKGRLMVGNCRRGLRLSLQENEEVSSFGDIPEKSFRRGNITIQGSGAFMDGLKVEF